MFFFGLGKLLYEVRHHAPPADPESPILTTTTTHYIVGWGRVQSEPAFGTTYDSTSVKAKTINLISSVRTVMRGESIPLPTHLPPASRDETRRDEVPLIAINIIIIVYELILG
ncbi:hypothetical protein AOCH_004955 [Aspergillus ochraceoroseus]|uniref:Uncharacterized protein n=1 Tax=Aspergillus ochraceoroseus TaxID=138278 RepID=A0A0F8UVJ0_9EURO|nr:hypothetical protein AOCH_004955 [Aspergillus ochraceoroseus]